MARENRTIATLDDANAAQQLIRAAARRLIDRWDAKDLEAIIRATERTQGYLRTLRQIEHTKETAP
jgi:hypothetical protein